MAGGIKKIVRYFLYMFVFSFGIFTSQLYLKSAAQDFRMNGGFEKADKFKLGLENIPVDFVKGLGEFNVGLITNQTGKDQKGKRNIDILLAKGVKIKKIFIPEHGIDGIIHTDKEISDSIDKSIKVPIISLYSKGQAKKMDSNTLKDIDFLIFDIQDCGMRHYTYISTLFEALNVASKYNKKFIVLDRPSMLGPAMEGPLVKKGFESFVSFAPIPLRHGMTIGELAIFYNKYILKRSVKLYIAKMKNYKRDSYANNKMLTYLSSGIRTTNACYGYSFLGLLGEISPFHIGLRTPNPFQCILLPDKKIFENKKWENLKKVLNSYGIENSFYRTFGKKNYFSGLQFKINDVYDLESFKLFINLILLFKKSGLKMEFSKLFDKAIGTDKVRGFFEGKIEKKELQSLINNDLYDFYKKALPCFLYQPLPKVKYLDLSDV